MIFRKIPKNRRITVRKIMYYTNCYSQKQKIVVQFA